LQEEKIMRTLWVWAALLALACGGAAGCSGDDRSDNGGDADGDSDGDSDSDSDADSDSDTDTGYVGPAIPPTCADAAEALTSVGCEFWTVDMDNWDDSSGMTQSADPLDYAVVVSNPHQDQSAAVSLESGDGTVIYSVDLAPLALEVIDVACASGCLVPQAEVNIQGIGEDKGFRLTSDVPVLAYQWNPYGAEIFSTDASLLVPVTSLTGTYLVASWPTVTPGTDMTILSQVTVVATEDGTQVTFIPKVAVEAYDGIGPLAAGSESAAFSLDAGDVMTIRSDAVGGDLTGTVVQANHTVAVFGGNSCAVAPDSAYCCCDHIEEQILPLEAWGTSTVLARPLPRLGCTAAQDTALWRIIAGADGMTVTFDPPAPAPAGASYTFASQGDVLQFLTPDNHLATGTFDSSSEAAPFFAYQVMTGALYVTCSAAQEGDPYMLQSPPAGQFLDRYVFSTDNVFDFAFDQIIVVREAGVTVELDCKGELPAENFQPVGATGWEVGYVIIDNPANDTGCLDGAHTLEASAPVGLSVVGSDYCQSYGYLGGVGVRSINPNPVIE
jgi:hypothetical protein